MVHVIRMILGNLFAIWYFCMTFYCMFTSATDPRYVVLLILFILSTPIFAIIYLVLTSNGKLFYGYCGL